MIAAKKHNPAFDQDIVVNKLLVVSAYGIQPLNNVNTYNWMIVDNTNVELLMKSLPNPDGKLVQHSAQAVVALSTQIDKLSSEEAKKHLLVLMTIMHTILSNTYSPDAIDLALRRAKKMCAGIPEFDEIATLIKKWWDASTQNNPIRSLY
jgi:hypothetical protein